MNDNFYKQIAKQLQMRLKENKEKEKRAEELIIANKELAFQNEEKAKRAEELIIANSNLIIANNAQGEFLVNISHELKTPLNVIFSIVQLFDMYCESGSLDNKRESIVKYIKSIKQNSYRLSKLINNIVDLSKIEAGFYKLNLSNNNIVQVVEEIVMSVTNYTESKGLNIIFDTDIEEKIIACDTEKIERIVLNLISNAIKFTDEGDEIFVDIKDKDKFVEISVKDNGIGIENKHLDMIFDRFKQVDKSLSRNTEGTGIGLSLVKSIVELHGGSIYVESEFGKGSKFTVMIPSGKVIHENMIYSSEVPSKNQSILVELSDIYM
ncbi:MAG: HAMP domain-containing histidine kinase [Clostridium sp.]